MAEVHLRHGDARLNQKTSEYKIWVAMKARCRNPKHPKYEYYGGRGLTVCDRWNDYSNFLTDLGRKPSPLYTLERRDNNKGYNPDNCYWDTRKRQAENRRTNMLLTVDGDTKTLSQWATISGVKSHTIWARLKGPEASPDWTVKGAIFTPPYGKRA